MALSNVTLSRRILLASSGALAASVAVGRASAAADPVPISGTVAPGFECVRDSFAENFALREEVGAAVAVYLRGQRVVDLWGGTADEATGRLWEQNTTALWMSCTKGLTTTVVHLLAQRGVLNLDAPVARYWPEFAANGKAGITIAQILSHRSGMAVIDPPYLNLDDVIAWTPLVEAMARQSPVWTPGTAHGYHALTFGFLLDEVVRRATGRSIGQLLDSEIARPLGLQMWIGLPASEEPNVAPVINRPRPPADERVEALNNALADPTTLTFRALTNPVTATTWEEANTPKYHSAPLTSANAIGTARSMAKHYAALVGIVDGVRILSPITLARATRVQSSGTDLVLPLVDCSWGLGYGTTSELFPYPTPWCFGHNGAGGSVAFADPARQLAFAYLPNNLIPDYDEPRAAALVRATYRALGVILP